MTRFVIDKNDIIHNVNEVRRITDAMVIPTLKADCYGLGAEVVFKLLRDECGILLFAVSRLSEALPIGKRGADILLLSCYHDDVSIKTALENNLILSVDSLSLAKRVAAFAAELGVPARVHVKIDTGFGRFGFMPEKLPDIAAVYGVEGLEVKGIFSHFSNAFCKNPDVTDKQFEIFEDVCDALYEKGIDVGIRHIANSSAALRDKKYALDAVRIGSALTGRLPMRTDADLVRIGRFETEVSDIRNLKKGANIGYGNVFKLKKDTRVAVLCVGSADGVLIKKDYDTYRLFDILRYGFGVFKMLFRDNRLYVKVNGRRVPTVGRVALTHKMVDVSGIECKCGDKAVIDISPLYISPNVEREYV